MAREKKGDVFIIGLKVHKVVNKNGIFTYFAYYDKLSATSHTLINELPRCHHRHARIRQVRL